MTSIEITCISGSSAGRPVLLGFANASLLHAISFADVLDEDTGRGYQRRFNAQHSLDFRRYIQKLASTTIPLTFNLRPTNDHLWQVVHTSGFFSKILLRDGDTKILTQVDCQHRLGHLGDLSIELPFMFFVGLSVREEMEVFSIINSKAKGLNTSLLDFHDAQLAADLANDRPELYIAIFLKNEVESPWYRQLDFGGVSTSGMTRRASLRTLQKAIKHFLAKSKMARQAPIDDIAQLVLNFWGAVALVLPEQWSNPRKYMVTKGIGVYALMEIAADLVVDAPKLQLPDKRYFIAALSDFATEFDWSTGGPLQGLGGESGVKAAVKLIREARQQARFRIVSDGQ